LGDSLGLIVLGLVYLATIVFAILTAIKRSHDMDWSGWTVLLTLIPLVGLIWIFKPGSAGTNAYGAPPPPNTLGVKILGLLLPTIAVIGILAAIAIPAYVEYQRRAAGG
jgi:cbb3-type cytochrome oxidase subunit 3